MRDPLEIGARFGIGGVLVLLVLGIVGCGGDDSTATPSTQGGTVAVAGTGTVTASGTVAVAGTIKLGFIADRAGAYQAFGVVNYNSSKMAVDEINKAGGVTVGGKRYNFELDVCDSRTEETQASACAIQLVEDHKDKFLFGAIGKLAPIAMQTADAAGAIYFTSSSSAASKVQDTKYMIVTLLAAQMRIDLSVKAIQTFYPNAKRIAVLVPDEATAQGVMPLLKPALEKAGLQLVADERVPVGATDLSAALTRVRASKPDVLFTGWTPADVQAMVRQSRDLDATPAFFAYATGCADAIAAGIDRPYVANPLVGADPENPATQVTKDFVARYKAYTGDQNPVSLYAALWNYDFYFILKQAIEKAGTFENTAAVRDALVSLNYSGVIGPISFDRQREALYGFDMCYVTSTTSPVQTKHITIP